KESLHSRSSAWIAGQSSGPIGPASAAPLGYVYDTPSSPSHGIMIAATACPRGGQLGGRGASIAISSCPNPLRPPASLRVHLGSSSLASLASHRSQRDQAHAPARAVTARSPVGHRRGRHPQGEGRRA